MLCCCSTGDGDRPVVRVGRVGVLYVAPCDIMPMVVVDVPVYKLAPTLPLFTLRPATPPYDRVTGTGSGPTIGEVTMGVDNHDASGVGFLIENDSVGRSVGVLDGMAR